MRNYCTSPVLSEVHNFKRETVCLSIFSFFLFLFIVYFNALERGAQWFVSIEDTSRIGALIASILISSLASGIYTFQRMYQLKIEIEKRQKIQDELQKQTSRLRVLMDSVPKPIYYKDVNGIIFDCNKSYEALIGKDRGEIIGKTFEQLDICDSAKFHSEKDQELFKSKTSQTYEYTMIYRTIQEEKQLVFNKAPLLNASGNVVGLVGVISDITSAKKINEERIQLSIAMQHAADSVVITDYNGIIRSANPAFYQITDYLPTELIGQHLRIFKLTCRAPYSYKDVIATITKGEVWQGYLFIHTKTNIIKEFETTISPIRDAYGKITSFITIGRDVTDEKKLEKKIREVEKLQALGTLAGGIAHDFNNILAAILGYTELLLLSINGNIKHQEYLKNILNASERAKLLVQQILMFSRKNEHEKQCIEITPVIKETLQLLRASLPSTIKINTDIDCKIPITVMADATQLHQVVMNLCTNSAYAMPDGGILDISICCVNIDKADTSQFHDLIPGKYVKLVISDTGSGIPHEIINCIFDPYFTTKPLGKGSGLGLAVVYGIIKNHKGEISVYSEVNTGTTFKVYLPVIESIDKKEKMKTEIYRGSGKVLLVDDEKALVDVCGSMLSHLGYQVITATSSHEALELFMNDPDLFNVVITDLTMPQMDGIQLSRKIHEKRPTLPIVLCTGFSSVIATEKTKQHDITKLLMKPISIKDLSTTLKEVLGN